MKIGKNFSEKFQDGGQISDWQEGVRQIRYGEHGSMGPKKYPFEFSTEEVEMLKKLYEQGLEEYMVGDYSEKEINNMQKTIDNLNKILGNRREVGVRKQERGEVPPPFIGRKI